MANMMKWASDWFEDCRDTHLASSIVYVPCGQPDIEGVKATFGLQAHQAYDESGALINYETWDFILKRSALSGYRPQIGDKIYVTSDEGDIYRYDVTQTPAGRCYRDHDRFKDSIVVHCDEYDVEEA